MGGLLGLSSPKWCAPMLQNITSYCDQSKVHDQITTSRYLNTEGGRFRPSRLPKRILPELAGVYGRSVGRERTDLLASAMICALVLVLGAS